MKKRILIINILSILLLIGGIFTGIAAGQDAPPAIKVAVALNNTSYLMSEPIIVTITVENQDVDVITSRGFKTQDFHLRLVFTDPEGKRVIADELLSTANDPGPPPLCDNNTQCEPVEIFESTDTLITNLPNAHAYYRLKKTGKWKIRAEIDMKTYPKIDETRGGTDYALLANSDWKGTLVSSPDQDFDLIGDSDGDGYISIESGGDDCDDNNPSINPGLLSLMDIDKLEVEWNKQRIRMHGRVALSCSDYFNAGAAGSASLRISDPPVSVFDEQVTFQVKGAHDEKWEYTGNSTGIEEFKIDWKGAKFKYDQEISLSSNHLGYGTTTLEIDRREVTEPLTIRIGEATISINEAGSASVTPDTIPLDVDEDGEIEVELPFSVYIDDIFDVQRGSSTYQVRVSDYFTSAIGKFKITSAFNPDGLDGSLTPRSVNFNMTVGNKSASGTLQINEADWLFTNTKQWKYKK